MKNKGSLKDILTLGASTPSRKTSVAKGRVSDNKKKSEYNTLNKNTVSLLDDSNLEDTLKSLQVGHELTPIKISKTKVNITELECDQLFVNGEVVQTGTEIAGATQLNDLSDVTYSSGDLVITGLDKISVAGDLDIIVAGGDINFKAHEYGSGYDGGVSFNITSDKVEFIRNIEGGTPSRMTFDIGVTSHSIGVSSGDDLVISGDGDLEFSQGSTFKKIDFIRSDSGFGDVRLETANEWSALAMFRDFVNATSGATGVKTYSLLRGHLNIESDAGFDNTFLARLESSTMKTTTYTNYGGTVAGTIKGNATDHGFYTGDILVIEDTTNYNGNSGSITKIDDDNYYFTKTYVSDQTGKAYRSSTNVVADRLYGDFAVKVGGDIYTQGNISMYEQSAAPDHIAGYGKLWVKNVAPNNLYFTDDAGNDIAITNNGSLAGGGGSTTLKWHQSFGGYRTNNTSTTVYYMPYRITGESWTNGDSTISSVNMYDTPSAWIMPHDGTITKIQIQGYIRDTGATDPVKFYVFKGTSVHDASSTSLTQITSTSAITVAAADRVFTSSTTISSGNSLTAGDGIWLALKKDSNTGNQDMYFSITISGEYS